MKGKKRPDLHIVNQDDLAEAVGNAIMEEIQEENDLLDELEEKIRRHKRRFFRKIAIIVTAVVLILSGAYMYVTHQTYTKVRIVNTFSSEADSGERYAQFAGGILKYSRDGAAFMDRRGKEKWNSSYQIQNPVVSVKENAAAVADKGGNSVVVFQKSGLKGEIHTSLPIEKIAVSSQGVVSAVLKDETTSRIVCYDAAGNILVEHKTTATGTGYPLDIDISDNGYMLAVSYLLVENGTITSRIAYYNFGEEGKQKENYLVTEDTYEDVVIPTVFFLNNNVSAAVATDGLILYEGKEIPEKKETVKMGNGIRSVFHDDKYIGIVSNADGKNTVQLYNRSGSQVMSETFEGEFKNIKIEKNQIIMFDGKQCIVIAKNGVHKFEGEFENDIADVIPLSGINKYLVINADGLQEVRFAK